MVFKLLSEGSVEKYCRPNSSLLKKNQPPPDLFSNLYAEPMKIKLDPERQVVRPGDNAMISCTATGEQPITLSWRSADNQQLPYNIRADGGVIQVSDEDYKLENYSGI